MDLRYRGRRRRRSDLPGKFPMDIKPRDALARIQGRLMRYPDDDGQTPWWFSAIQWGILLALLVALVLWIIGA